MRRLVPLLILALALLAGCSTRARLNPFDPGNPETGGRPRGFVALAGNQLVTLRWEATTAPGLVGYQVFRQAPGASGFEPLTDVLPLTTTTIGDYGLLNGSDHRYRLYFVTDEGLGTLPAEDVATPGPLRPWVADYGDALILRLTADGRHVVQSVAPAPGCYPVAVDVTPADGRLWAVGPGGDVLVYDPRNGTRTRIGQSVKTAVSVVASRSDSSAWVGDAYDDRVVHLLPSGTYAFPAQLIGLKYPGGLALDPSNGSLWVADGDSNRVYRYASGGGLTVTAVVTRPSRVAVDAGTHEAWVTSFETGLVVRLSFTGAVLDTITGLGGPIGVAVDATRGRIWVADARNDAVVALARDGAVQSRTAGLPEAREIAVDATTGEAWVTLASVGAVARLAADGHEILRVGGMGQPWGIALDDVSARAVVQPLSQPVAGTRSPGAR